jgi:hypothetical protein
LEPMSNVSIGQEAVARWLLDLTWREDLDGTIAAMSMASCRCGVPMIAGLMVVRWLYIMPGRAEKSRCRSIVRQNTLVRQ